MAVIADTVEGVVDEAIWFHYDLRDDVLYLRLADRRGTPAIGEETDDGFILLRAEDDGSAIGLTVVNWWSRFGQGDRPDSIRQLARCIEPWTERLAA